MPCRTIVPRMLGLIVFVLAGSLTLVRAEDGVSLPKDQSKIITTYTFPDIPLGPLQNLVLPDHPIADDRGMMLGGVGSDLWHGPDDPADEFWLVTDRGPNGEIDVEVDGEKESRRTFPVPDFAPLILHVRATRDTLTVLEAIPIVNQEGEPVGGLPNLKDVDEDPFDFAAEDRLDLNQDGLDVEGLVRTSDGDFWLADEYRPSLVKVDATGKVLVRYVPKGVALPAAGYPVEDTLPAIYGMRKDNRGFEGLALSGDQQTLYAVMQSPLSNPKKKVGENSRNVRILVFSTASGRPLAEHVYQSEAAHEFEEIDQDEVKLSGLVWLDETKLLVLERTDLVARIYLADLAGATNILDTGWDEPGTDAAPSLEAQKDLGAADVVPLAKTLLVYLESLPEMPDKIEGVAVYRRRNGGRDQ